MNLFNFYSTLIIEPLEKEIKNLKRKINKRINLTRDIDKKNLLKLQNNLYNYYKIFYELSELKFKE